MFVSTEPWITLHIVLEALLSGTLLGLSAGISPGPLLVVVISLTLSHSMKDGLKAAAGPLLTDLPIIIASLLLLDWLSDSGPWWGLLSLAGGMFVLYLAWDTLQARRVEVPEGQEDAHALRKGALVNLLSPHPYIFWFTVGAPLVVRVSGDSWTPGGAFVLSFLFCLVGSKMLVAVLFARAREIIVGRPYVYTMRILGLLLVGFGLWLVGDAVERFGLLA